MYRIQLNQSGTRYMNITETHLRTIHKYLLFRDLIDSNGYVDESVLEKLKLNVRSLIGSSTGDIEDLLRLAADVIYNDKMKSFGLRELILLYIDWRQEQKKNNAMTISGT